MKTIRLLTYLFLAGMLLQGCNFLNTDEVLRNQTGTFIAGASPAADGPGLLFETPDTTYGVTGSWEDYSHYFPENEYSIEISADVRLTGETAVRGWGVKYPEADLMRIKVQ